MKDIIEVDGIQYVRKDLVDKEISDLSLDLRKTYDSFSRKACDDLKIVRDLTEAEIDASTLRISDIEYKYFIEGQNNAVIFEYIKDEDRFVVVMIPILILNAFDMLRKTRCPL